MNNYKKYLGIVAFTNSEFEGLPSKTLVQIIGTLKNKEKLVNKDYELAVKILNQNTLDEWGHALDGWFLDGWFSEPDEYNFLENIDLSLENYYYVPFRILNFLSND